MTVAGARAQLAAEILIALDLSRDRRPIVEAATRITTAVSDLVAAAKAEGAREENANLLKLANEAKTLATETTPRK
jgi:hypothetical protein